MFHLFCCFFFIIYIFISLNRLYIYYYVTRYINTYSTETHTNICEHVYVCLYIYVLNVWNKGRWVRWVVNTDLPHRHFYTLARSLYLYIAHSHFLSLSLFRSFLYISLATIFVYYTHTIALTWWYGLARAYRRAVVSAKIHLLPV